MGCLPQVLAASRAACREATRRLPEGRETLYAAMVELIGDGRDAGDLDDAGRVARTVSLAHADRLALRDAFRARAGPELRQPEAARRMSTRSGSGR